MIIVFFTLFTNFLLTQECLDISESSTISNTDIKLLAYKYLLISQNVILEKVLSMLLLFVCWLRSG